MKFIEPEKRPPPSVSERTHARLRHDHALWHPEHVAQAMKAAERGSHRNSIPFSDRSKFDSAKIIEEAISRSHHYMAEEARNGNHVVVFDMGYEVGFDERAKRRTAAVTVILRKSGEVITVHPGTPWARDQSET